jgi:hypothetical protein
MSRRARNAAALLTCVACALGAGCARSSEPAGKLSVEPKEVRLGYPLSIALSLSWEPARALDKLGGHPLVFIHLLDREERPRTLLRTYDYPLAKAWRPGQALHDVIDVYQSALADPLPPGHYLLTAGLYDSGGGERWPLVWGAAPIGKMEYRIASVEVTTPDPSGPKFDLTGEWLPAESMASKQVTVRRCLAGPATVGVTPGGASGSVRMLLNDPPQGPAEIRITSACMPGGMESVSSGLKWFDFPIGQIRRDTGRCEITLVPVEPSPPRPSAQRVNACLDVLSWRPAGNLVP